MKSAIFITASFNSQILDYIKPLLATHTISVYCFQQEEMLPLPPRLQVLLPISEISLRQLLQATPFYLTQQCEWIEFITPTRASFMENFKWKLYFSYLTGLGKSCRLVGLNSLPPKRLFQQNSEMSRALTNSHEQSLLIPCSIADLKEMELKRISQFLQHGIPLSIWGWGPLPIPQQHQLRTKYQLYHPLLKIVELNDKERSLEFNSASQFFIPQTAAAHISELDLIALALQGRRLYFTKTSLEILKAPWHPGENCHCLTGDQLDLGPELSSQNHDLLRTYLEKVENDRLRSWNRNNG